MNPVSSDKDGIWPPPETSKQLVCPFCQAFLTYAKRADVTPIGFLEHVTQVKIHFTMVCASCRKEFAHEETHSVEEVKEVVEDE